MHILSANYRSEFLATPELVRIDLANGINGLEPSLLIKSTTLLLKFIIQKVKLQLIFMNIEGRLIYAVKIFDDLLKPSTLWSAAETKVEKEALMILLKNKMCASFIFNELAVNVSWTNVRLQYFASIPNFVLEAKVEGVNYGELSKKVSNKLRMIERDQPISDDCLVVDLHVDEDWNDINNHYVTNAGYGSLVNLFNNDEGGQQEQLAIWLTDNLQPVGGYHSPKIPNGNITRELTDLLLTYESGSFLIESKTLSIFNRSSLPNRDKLSKDVNKHIKKALKQLKGSIRKIKAGARIKDNEGSEIEIERTNHVHAIILIPELNLIENPADFGIDLIEDFMDQTGGFIHLLDISELLRIIQATEAIYKACSNVTFMMAFDYYLIERAKLARESETLRVEVLFRMEN